MYEIRLNGVGCEIVPSNVLGASHLTVCQYTWHISQDGTNGKNGGYGGAGGNGGNPGNVIIVKLHQDLNIPFHNTQGSDGTEGFGGNGGKAGKHGKILEVSGMHNFYVSSPAGWYAHRDISLQQDSRGEANSGTPGLKGYNSANIMTPEAVPFLNPSYTINSYKNYLRENLSGNILESDLRDFLNLLETNGNVDTISRSLRHHHGENHQRVQRDIDYSNNIQYNADGIIVAADSTENVLKPISENAVNEIKNNIPYLKNQDTNIIDHIVAEDTKFAMSSASNIKSPINTAINWLSNSFTQLKFLSSTNIMTNYEFIKDSIQSIFAKSEHIGSDNIKNNNVTSINMGQFDINSSLTLTDFIIRCITKVKPYNTKKESIDLLEVTAYVLNIITEFEEMLNEASAQNNLPIDDLEFNPVVLMSKLEKAVINGNYTKIGKILYQSIINNNSNLDETQFISYIQDKINEMLEQQSTWCLYDQQFITDHTNNATIVDMNNTIGIANAFNHTDY